MNSQDPVIRIASGDTDDGDIMRSRPAHAQGHHHPTCVKEGNFFSEVSRANFLPQRQKLIVPHHPKSPKKKSGYPNSGEESGEASSPKAHRGGSDRSGHQRGSSLSNDHSNHSHHSPRGRQQRRSVDAYHSTGRDGDNKERSLSPIPTALAGRRASLDDVATISSPAKRSDNGTSLPNLPSIRFQDSVLNASMISDLEEIAENYSMCHTIPISSEPQALLLGPNMHQKDSKSKKHLVLETRGGELVAKFDTDFSSDQRFLRDANNNLAAIVMRHRDSGDGTFRYRIFGGEALYKGQRRVSETGLYKWGDVKASKNIGLRFTMQVKARPPELTKYFTEHYGPSLFNLTKPRGFAIKKDDDAVAKVTRLGDKQGLALAPDVDPCLIVCFVAIIDEMTGKRLR